MHNVVNGVRQWARKRPHALLKAALERRGAVEGLAASVLGIALLAGCSASVAPRVDEGAGLSCVDDSSRCVKARINSVKVLTARQDRRWLRKKPGPKAYASGVRLFALRNNKAVLTCEELGLARKEAKAARRVLRQPGSGLSPAQISRATMLAGEVHRDLAREARRRCR